MEENKEILTEVTTIAKEEEKLGKPVMPRQLTEEELVARHSASFISLKKQYYEIFRNLSSKAKTRVSLAVLDLPTDGIPVSLKEQEEKYAFMLGQQALASRFVITQFHINREILERRKQEELNKQKVDVKNLEFIDESQLNKGDTNEQQ